LLLFDYHQDSRQALLIWDKEDDGQRWLKILSGTCLDASEEAQRVGSQTISLPWWSFLGIRQEILNIISAFQLRSGHEFEISQIANDMLNEARLKQQSFFSESHSIINSNELKLRLKSLGFKRELTDQQLRNVSKLINRRSGATFSVPGAGKTTEAIAFYTLSASENDKLLIVAPKNAFSAWDEQIAECIPSFGEQFIRLRKTDKIPSQLLNKPKLIIIGYQQLVRVKDHISKFLFENDVHVFLDESHKVKNPNSLAAQAILKFSHLPKTKLIMSGTPMPQSVNDLVPQFNFLYPEIRTNVDTVVKLVQKVYVRTNKAELNLPEVVRKLTKLNMDTAQQRLYRLLRSEFAREAERVLSENSKDALRKFGRSVTSLLQFVSNPALLANKPEFKFAEELSDALAEGDGPKIRYVIDRTRELTQKGHKVLIWTSFVKNVEYLSECFRDLGAVYIHGGVDAGSDEDEDTREGKIKKFHDDPNVQVMVANPAAASEGISLHRVCHHAIYLDRNFNAAQYLQSEDRIHRLGLKENQLTHIEIVECINTIDETVRQRLEIKVSAMARVLEDSSLNISPLHDTHDDFDMEGFDTADMERGDIQALVDTIGVS
jgi:SNF2 family DNA or RNA helicase